MNSTFILAALVCFLVGMLAGATIFPRISTADLQTVLTEAAE